jgi:radical SAM superfamily enzyme YgiQ (UPF0313 family)
MKILLIPPVYQYNHHYPAYMPSILFPTGFAYVASALQKAGHEVHGLNMNNTTGYPTAHLMIQDKIEQAIEKIEPNLIALGGLCTDYLFIKDTIDIIKRESNIPIVLGGGIVTHDSEYIFNLLKPDFCIVGEAEEVIVQIANMLSGKKTGNYIPNMGYWKNNNAAFTEQNFNYKDLDLLLFPNYDIFNIQQGGYALTSRYVYRFIRQYPKPWTIITARSCPFQCTFCVHGTRPIKYRTRSIDNVIKEIEYTYNKYKYNILVILDELFAVNKTRMIEFCTKLIENKEKYNWDFDWSFGSHASSQLDKDTLMLAKKSGCFFSGYGLESASPRVLYSMNKKITPAQVADIIDKAKEVNITFGANLIFGDPVETEDTVLESLKFMVDKCNDVDLSVNAIRPYPGSKLFDDCVNKGIIKDKFDYYEHIDEQPWNFIYNMTSMPNKKWLPLLDSIIAYGQLLPWLTPVKPINYEVEYDFIGKQVYKIDIECPHCKQVFTTRELLRLGKQNINSKATIKDIKLVKDAIIKALRLIHVYYFSFTNPIYKLMRKHTKTKNLLWQSFFSTIFFATACPYCRKTMKVSICIPFTLKIFSLSEIKRRLNIA